MVSEKAMAELRGLVAEFRSAAKREEADTNYLLRDGVAEQQGIAIGIGRCADELDAASTS